jgi:hypothetical protein
VERIHYRTFAKPAAELEEPKGTVAVDAEGGARGRTGVADAFSTRSEEHVFDNMEVPGCVAGRSRDEVVGSVAGGRLGLGAKLYGGG